MPYYGQEAQAAGAPSLPITVTSTRRSDGWDLDLQVVAPSPDLRGGA